MQMVKVVLIFTDRYNVLFHLVLFVNRGWTLSITLLTGTTATWRSYLRTKLETRRLGKTYLRINVRIIFTLKKKLNPNLRNVEMDNVTVRINWWNMTKILFTKISKNVRECMHFTTKFIFFTPPLMNLLLSKNAKKC